MIDSFKIKANNQKNQLIIQLRGFFMKSEIELAFYLARKECEKLNPGFEVVLDLDGMHTNMEYGSNLTKKVQHIFTSLGAGRVKSVGATTYLPKIKASDIEYFAFENVGFYPN